MPFPLYLGNVTMLSVAEISSCYLLGVLFGCLSNFFFDVSCCFLAFCFWPFSLSFFPPLSPIACLLSLLSKTSSHSVVSVATTVGPSLLIVILHIFRNLSITAFQEVINILSHPKNHPSKIACFNSVYFHIHIHRSMTFFEIANVLFFAYGHYVNGLLIIR